MSELEKKGDEQLNHLLSMSLDVESLFFLVQKEEDTDTKQVHFYLFKVIEPTENGSLLHCPRGCVTNTGI